MKIPCVAAGAALFAFHLVSFAQTEIPCGKTLDTLFRSRNALTIDSRPAGLQIVGTDQERIHVDCTASDNDTAGEIQLRYSEDSGHAKLTIAGGGEARHGNLHIRIELPRRTNLKVRMSAGQVKIDKVTGDKDLELYAGQITIASPGDWDYRQVEASVDIGEVKAPVYGADKGGFFREVKKTTSDGEYRLYAHVTTGEIDLLGSNSQSAPD